MPVLNLEQIIRSHATFLAVILQSVLEEQILSLLDLDLRESTRLVFWSLSWSWPVPTPSLDYPVDMEQAGPARVQINLSKTWLKSNYLTMYSERDRLVWAECTCQQTTHCSFFKNSLRETIYSNWNLEILCVYQFNTVRHALSRSWRFNLALDTNRMISC